MAMTDAEFADWQASMLAQADQNRAAVMVANVGDAVTAPRGGEPCKVAKVYVDGGRIVTGNGHMPTHWGWCKCTVPSGPVYFEAVGGSMNGSHGWWCPTCGGVTQWG